MKSAGLEITRLYQFISEAVLIYLFLQMLLWLFNVNFSFSSFLVLTVLYLIFGLIAAKIAKTLFTYFLLGCLIVLFAVVFLDYSFPLTLLTAGCFSWRWISHQKDADQQNEKQVLIWSFVLIAIYTFFWDQSLYIWIGFIQLTLLVGGYMTRHIASMERDRLAATASLLLFSSIFTFGLLIVPFIFPSVRFVFRQFLQAVVYIFGTLVGGLYSFVGFFGFELKPSEDNGSSETTQEMGAGDSFPNLRDEFDPAVVNQAVDILTWIFWSCACIAVILLIVYLSRKNINQEKTTSPQVDIVTMSLHDKAAGPERNSIFISRAGLGKPKNSVRRLFYDFEKFAVSAGCGRKKHETIEEWFNRIGLSANHVDLYQKVRYGEIQLTEMEIREFKKSINGLKDRIIKDNNGGD
ncbi:hypothetical protein [Sediminibacillus massiliensis]|uniref:hypothetical protein n=1 Tax=Sediminibacillus massiliensis TaxID=1926277 RepID=UPI0009885830|nr:hypothetical protein [Sediminibacillus massiliensis]